MKNFIISAAVAACIGAASAAAVSDLCLKTTKYKLFAETETDIKVVAVSDLHFAKFGKNNARLIDAVKKENPDMILLAGDFFDFHAKKSNEDAVKKLFCALSEICPVYFSAGNHDMRFNLLTGKNCFDMAAACGVRVLSGEYDDIEIRGQKVRIGGIFDHSVYLEDYGEHWHSSDVYKFLTDFQQTDSIKLLIMHRPNTFIHTEDEWDINAVFCGHDHGGIWNIPFLGGVYAPEQGFLPEYYKGEYSFGKMKMYLSAGLEGYYLIPRFLNRAEIVSVTLTK